MEFEDRAVAFIDVLGFNALVNKAVANEQMKQKLVALVTILESAIPKIKCWS